MPSPPINVFRMSCLSALATGVCIGGTLSLPFWHGLLVAALPSTMGSSTKVILSADALADNWFIYVTGSGATWGWVLGRLTGYRRAWVLALAGGLSVAVGFMIATSSPFLNFVNGQWRGEPLYIRFVIEFVLGIGFAAGLIGLAFGIALRSARAAVGLMLASTLPAALSALVVTLVLDFSGVRVGTGNLAMAKIAALGFMFAALTAGAVIGPLFRHFSHER